MNNVAKNFKVIWEHTTAKLPVLLLLPWVLQYLRSFFIEQTKETPSKRIWSKNDCITIWIFILYMKILNSWGCGKKKKTKLFLNGMIFKHLPFLRDWLKLFICFKFAELGQTVRVAPNSQKAWEEFGLQTLIFLDPGVRQQSRGEKCSSLGTVSN